MNRYHTFHVSISTVRPCQRALAHLETMRRRRAIRDRVCAVTYTIAAAGVMLALFVAATK